MQGRHASYQAKLTWGAVSACWTAVALEDTKQHPGYPGACAAQQLYLVWCLEQEDVEVLQGWCEVYKEEFPPSTMSLGERGIIVVGKGRQRGLDRLATWFC